MNEQDELWCYKCRDKALNIEKELETLRTENDKLKETNQKLRQMLLDNLGVVDFESYDKHKESIKLLAEKLNEAADKMTSHNLRNKYSDLASQFIDGE